MMRKIVFIPILFMYTICFGQSGVVDFTPPIFSPSPNVMEMNRYLEQPVDYSTGVPSISIPIYTIQQGDIKIPISLDYYAGGIKVEQEATTVGLGWSLNAGGAVSREIRSLIDDFKYGDYGGFMYQKYKLRELLAHTVPYDYEINSIDPQDHKGFDFEADLFSYILPSAGGRQFQFDQNDKKFYENEISNNKIEYSMDNWGQIIGWNITDTNGVKYYFGGDYVETNFREVITPTYISPASDQEPIGNVTWYLYKIVDAKGNDILFEYEQSENQIEYIQRIPITGNRGSDIVSFGNYCISKGFEKRISKIKFKNGYVDFVYSTSNRLDFINSKRLQTIRVFTNSDGNSQNAILNKKIELDNDHYFSSLITSGQTVESKYFDSNTKRLKLESILFKDPKNLQQIMKYQFGYDSTELPQKFSYAQDYWGGYNHENDNNDLFPETIFILPSGSFSTYKSRFNTERAINPHYVTAGTINKITYPTGGYTTYAFEPNTVSDYDFLPSTSILYPTSYHSKNIKNPYKLSVFNVTNRNGLDYSGCTKEPVNNINVNYSCKINITKPLQSMPYFGDVDFVCPADSFTPTIPGEITPVQDGQKVCNFKDPILVDSNGNSLLNGDRWASVLPGEYYLKIRFNGSLEILDNPNFNTYFNVFLNIKEDENINIRTVGGLRIKKIQNFDSTDQLLSEKEYQYEFEDNGIKLSTGKTMLPRFGIYETFFVYPQINGGQIPIEISFMSESNLNPFFTNKIQYGKVQEKIKNIVDNKYFTKIYESKNPITLNYITSAYNAENNLNRYSKSIDISWNNKPISEKLKNSTGNSVSETEYLNTSVLDHEKVFYTGFRSYQMSLKLGSGATLVPLNWNLHHHAISSYSVPISATITKYRANGTVTTLQNFAYSTNNPLLLSSEVTTSPDLTTTETTYTYAQDKGKQLMIAANMIGIPLETEVKKNGKTVSKAEMVYPDVLPDIQTGNLLLPKSTSSLDLVTGNMSTDVTYNQYDNKGNLQQYTTKSGIPTTIIWGYNQTKPIAKIEGATYAQVSSLATTIINASNDDANDTAVGNPKETDLLTALDTFRTNAALAGYQITTYSYDSLIGVRSITPPSGIREVYIYDTVNRLKEVRDVYGNILKSYEYNYKP